MADLWTREVGPAHRVIVHHDGMIYVESRPHVPVSNVDDYKAALDEARWVVRAVFPPADPGRTDLEFTAEERMSGYRALEAAGKMPKLNAGNRYDAPETVTTAFLRDWVTWWAVIQEGNAPSCTIGQFAEMWERQ